MSIFQDLLIRAHIFILFIHFFFVISTTHNLHKRLSFHYPARTCYNMRSRKDRSISEIVGSANIF
ncbi:hypothetical protein GIB67_011979, partial [Kingdonia uniflora]